MLFLKLKVTPPPAGLSNRVVGTPAHTTRRAATPRWMQGVAASRRSAALGGGVSIGTLSQFPVHLGQHSSKDVPNSFWWPVTRTTFVFRWGSVTFRTLPQLQDPETPVSAAFLENRMLWYRPDQGNCLWVVFPMAWSTTSQIHEAKPCRKGVLDEVDALAEVVVAPDLRDWRAVQPLPIDWGAIPATQGFV